MKRNTPYDALVNLLGFFTANQGIRFDMLGSLPA